MSGRASGLWSGASWASPGGSGGGGASGCACAWALKANAKTTMADRHPVFMVKRPRVVDMLSSPLSKRGVPNSCNLPYRCTTWRLQPRRGTFRRRFNRSAKGAPQPVQDRLFGHICRPILSSLRQSRVFLGSSVLWQHGIADDVAPVRYQDRGCLPERTWCESFWQSTTTN